MKLISAGGLSGVGFFQFVLEKYFVGYWTKGLNTQHLWKKKCFHIDLFISIITVNIRFKLLITLQSYQ